jgi:hypothetical protein
VDEGPAFIQRDALEKDRVIARAERTPRPWKREEIPSRPRRGVRSTLSRCGAVGAGFLPHRLCVRPQSGRVGLWQIVRRVGPLFAPRLILHNTSFSAWHKVVFDTRGIKSRAPRRRSKRRVRAPREPRAGRARTFGTGLYHSAKVASGPRAATFAHSHFDLPARVLSDNRCIGS